MVESNKIGSLSRTWPVLPTKKDRPDQNNQHRKKKDDKPESNDEHRDPGDTIIDEYV